MLLLRVVCIACWAWLLAIPLVAVAQPAREPYRIGWLTPTKAIAEHPFITAMGKLGYVEGKSFVLVRRSADDDLQRLPQLAVELANAKVDVIVAISPPAILAAAKATDRIPIIMAFWGAGGLLESGLVKSFARPGRNVTGVYMLADELEAKRLELLLQAVPKAKRVGVLGPGLGNAMVELKRFAQTAGVQLQFSPVGEGDDAFRRAFEAVAAAHVDALLVPSSPRFFRETRQIVDQAASHRLPAMYEWSSMAAEGGLMAYGPEFEQLESKVAAFVDRVLKGAAPSDLPVEQPTKFELVVNMKTAKALGMTIAPSLLLRADRVID